MEVPRTHVKEAVEVGTALQQASRMLAHAQHLAHYDPLTGLCNRVLFGELVLRELAVAQRSGASFAILAIDLDGFKAVNDMHGHAAGDTVLKEAADRMANAIRVSDVAARLGGDEFAILLLAANRESAQAVGEALVESLSPLCQRQGRGRRRLARSWLNCPALASRLFGELAVMSGAQKVAVEISHWNWQQPQCRHLVRPCGGGAPSSAIRGVSENFGPIGERR